MITKAAATESDLDRLGPDGSPNQGWQRGPLHRGGVSGLFAVIARSALRRQQLGAPGSAGLENKRESSAGGLPPARVSGAAPPRLVPPAPGGCDAAGSAVTAGAPSLRGAAPAPRARRASGADGPKTGTAGPGAATCPSSRSGSVSAASGARSSGQATRCGDAKHVVHPAGLALGRDRLAAEARISPQQDPHGRPSLPDLRDDPRKLVKRALRRVDVRRPQVAARHMLAALTKSAGRVM